MQIQTATSRAKARTDFVLRSAQDLIGFLTAWPWRWLGGKGQISLQLPLVEESLQRATARRLNFWRQVCGCQAGALALLAVLAWQVWAAAQSAEWRWTRLLVIAGYALLAAVAGKLLALVLARSMLIVDIARLWWRMRGASIAPPGCLP